MARLSHALATLAVLTLVGCGTQPQALTGARVATTSALAVRDESDHAQMNAIVRATLTDHQAFLFATVDANKDGAVSKSEYTGNGRANDAVTLFFNTFDADKNGAVTAPEYAGALKTDAPVEAYHHFTEERMGKAVKPYLADKNFEAEELRTYLVNDLDQTADWPFIFRLMDELDLNKDEKLLSGPGEGSAFVLKFAAPTLQLALGMPHELALKAARRK
jgi:hypothetical protein